MDHRAGNGPLPDERSQVTDFLEGPPTGGRPTPGAGDYSAAQGLAGAYAVGRAVIAAESTRMGEPPPGGDHDDGSAGRITGPQVPMGPFKADAAGVLQRR